MMAIAMMETCSTSPTAVMTESSEKTTSRIAICVSTIPRLAATTAVPRSSNPSRLLWIS
jgi:hypothetical protein